MKGIDGDADNCALAVSNQRRRSFIGFIVFLASGVRRLIHDEIVQPLFNQHRL